MEVGLRRCAGQQIKTLPDGRPHVLLRYTVQGARLFEECWLMFRFTRQALRASLALSAVSVFHATSWGQTASASAPQSATAPSSPANSVSRRIRANRQARIARTIQETYSHKYEIAGGGGYLRFREGQYLQKISQINFFGTGNYYFNPQLSIAADVRGMYGNGNIPNVFALNGTGSSAKKSIQSVPPSQAVQR